MKTSTAPGCRALRLGRISATGQAYLVTLCTDQRRPWFEEHALAEAVCEVVRAPTTWPAAELSAWILMPDHWHGLVVLKGPESLGTVVSRVKSLTTMSFPPGPGTRLWQRGFHDHALRSHETVSSVIAYILHNPVRKQLVARWEDWPGLGGSMVSCTLPR